MSHSDDGWLLRVSVPSVPSQFGSKPHSLMLTCAHSDDSSPWRRPSAVCGGVFTTVTDAIKSYVPTATFANTSGVPTVLSNNVTGIPAAAAMAKAVRNSDSLFVWNISTFPPLPLSLSLSLSFSSLSVALYYYGIYADVHNSYDPFIMKADITVLVLGTGGAVPMTQAWGI